MVNSKSDDKTMEWRLIPGFSRYELSENGLVRRRFKLRTRSAGSLVKGHVDDDGYRRYSLVDDKGKIHQMMGAHRLVAEIFIGPQPTSIKFQVQHKNGISLDNHFTNLKWGTPKDNIDDAVAHGCKWVRKFEENKCSKLNWKIVEAMRRRYVPKVVTCKRLGKEYGVTGSLVWLVVKNKVWIK